MATANLLWTPSLSTMIAPRPTIQQLSFGQPPSHFTAGGSTAAEFFAFSLAHPVADQICRGERNGGFLTRREKIPERRAPFSYTPPTSSFTLPSLRLSSRHAAMPITPVLKVMCPLAAKEGSTVAVAQAADDTQVAKRNINESTRRSSGKLSRKTIYTVMVGASFCAVVAVFSIVIVKQQALDFLVIPEISFRSIKKFLNVMLELASGWINIWFSFYYLNGLQNLGKRGKSKPSKKQCIRFNDVEGVDAAKAELLDIVLCIKGDSRYMKLGAKIPRGVLLAGPTGTGKTLLARAVAGEADVAFFSISASEFDQIFAGSGAACVRDLFRDARKRSPSIIFIDEIDAVGGQRGRCLNSERDQTLNQLLTEMDGFEECGNVVVIAATNRPELLDSALMRPGRFSRKVYVGEPDEDGRRKIFRLYLKEVKMEEDKEVICDLVASLTPGLVGADLANIANESVMLAARRGGDFVTKEDVLQAVERAITKICNDR